MHVHMHMHMSEYGLRDLRAGEKVPAGYAYLIFGEGGWQAAQGAGVGSTLYVENVRTHIDRILDAYRGRLHSICGERASTGDLSPRPSQTRSLDLGSDLDANLGADLGLGPSDRFREAPWC